MNHLYKSIEMVGTSTESFDDAVRSAIRRAGKSMRNLQWFEVVETRGYIEESDVKEFQVKVKVWFALDDGES